MRVTRSLLTGIAIAVILIGGASAALVATRVGGSGAHEMTIDFPSADGLVAGSDVLIAGSKIGTISLIKPSQADRALVTIQVENDHWPLHQGLRADIRPKSLLGEKYVDLHDGAATAGVYDPNRTLVAAANADPVELDQFINSLDPPTRTAVRVLLDDLGSGLAGNGNDLNTAIAAGKADLEHLAVFGTTLNNRDADLDRILVGLDGVLAKLTTDEQLNQMSQLITNGQNTLNDIESVQEQFGRGFNDAQVALSDLNTAIGGAVPALRSTIDVAPTLINNLQQEASLLANLGTYVTTSDNKSPNGECTSSAPQPDQPITSITGLQRCSPLWMLIAAILGGPTNTGEAVETNNSGSLPIFRGCVVFAVNYPATGKFGCKGGSGATLAGYGYTKDDSDLFASFLRS